VSPRPDGAPPLAGWPRWRGWVLLVGLTGLFLLPLELAGLPATMLLASMAAGITVQLTGGGIHLPRAPQAVAEALLGTLIAGAVTPIALNTFLQHAPLFLALVLTIIAASTALGLLLHRMRLLPGTTAIWGLSPGAAQAMMLMSGAFGGDPRLVAFMQYLRVLMVAAIAPVVARFWADPSGVAQADIAHQALSAAGLGSALAIAGVGLLLATRLRIPAGTILVPLALGGVLHALGLVPISLPQPLMATAYAAIGWGVGLAFTLPVLRHALSVLPQVAAATLVLIGFAGGLAALLAQLDGIDPLTAYLATSPGGMSAMAVIAATSKADLAFVVSLQTVRFVLVLFLGPAISRFIALRVGGSA
jgi:uncharacterized protein